MLKKRLKSALSVIISVMICLSVLQLSGMPVSSETVSNSPYSGECGFGIYYAFNPDTGELIISGEGDDWDYNYGQYPWSSDLGDERFIVKKLTVEEGITSIYEYAFYESEMLTEVQLPSTLERIGTQAFAHCTSLNEITLPDNISEINGSAFNGCTELSSINLPDKYIDIYEDAFFDTEYYNTNENWLYDTTVGIDNSEYHLLYIGNHLIYADTLQDELVLRDGTVNIANFAFGYETKNSIVKLVIPGSLKYIPIGTFSSMSNLETVIINEGVECIGSSAFAYCEKLSAVSLPTSLTDIESYTFEGCSALNDITLPEKTLNIGSWAFSNTGFYNKSSNWGTIKDSDNNVLFRYLYLQNILIHLLPEENAELSEYALEYNVRSSTVAIAGGAFADLEFLSKVSIPNTVQVIGESAFANCIALNKISLPTELKKLGASAFYNCSALESITIPDSIEVIEWATFSECISIKSVYLPTGLKEIEGCAFESCEALSRITLVEGLEKIGERAFQYCNELSNLDIPSTTLEIGENAFEYCDFSSIIIPAGTKRIESGLFFNCQKLREITIPASVQFIGNSAFERCEKLEKVNIPEGIRSIYPYTFSKCSALTEIILPESVEHIYNDAFSNCTSIKTVDFGSNIISIGEMAFQYCEALEEITLPSSINKISEYAFENCTALAEISLPDTALIIANYAFNNTAYYNNENSKTTDGLDAWVTSGSNKYLYIGKHLICSVNLDSALSSLEIREGTITVGDYALQHCSYYISSVSIPSSVKRIGNNAFYGCQELTELTLPEALEYIGDYAFGSCGNISKLNIPKNVKSIGDYAFVGCYDLTLIVKPASTAHSYAIRNELNYIIDGTVIGINLESLPEQKIYSLGSALSMYGLKVIAEFEDGIIFDVTNQAVINECDMSTAGLKTVNVSYGGFTKSFSILVNPKLLSYPESLHPYEDSCDVIYSYTHIDNNVTALKVTFSTDTYVEYYYDEIYIYNGQGAQIGDVYTGDALAGQTVEISGNSFSIRLKSDSSANDYGFKITNIEAIGACEHSYKYVKGTTPSTSEMVCEHCGDSYLMLDFDFNGVVDDSDIDILDIDYLREAVDTSAVDFDNDGNLSDFDETIIKYLVNDIDFNKMIDVNNDGKTDLRDFLIQKIGVALSSDNTLIYDRNFDGIINDADAEFSRKFLTVINPVLYK